MPAREPGKGENKFKKFLFPESFLKKSSNRTTSYLYHLTFVNFQVGNWDTVQQKFFFGGLLEFHVNWDTVNFFSSSKSLAFPIYKGKKNLIRLILDVVLDKHNSYENMISRNFCCFNIARNCFRVAQFIYHWCKKIS